MVRESTVQNRTMWDGEDESAKDDSAHLRSVSRFRAASDRFNEEKTKLQI